MSTKLIGSWVSCRPCVEHKRVKVMFFKTPDYPYSFCSMCLYRAKERNGTLIIPPKALINSRDEAKPEKDTL